jgi:hypothetical protein
MKKPLRQLNFTIIQEPLTGLLRNMDSDLQRRIKEVQAAGNVDEHRQLTLLHIASIPRTDRHSIGNSSSI